MTTKNSLQFTTPDTPKTFNLDSQFKLKPFLDETQNLKESMNDQIKGNAEFTNSVLDSLKDKQKLSKSQLKLYADIGGPIAQSLIAGHKSRTLQENIRKYQHDSIKAFKAEDNVIEIDGKEVSRYDHFQKTVIEPTFKKTSYKLEELGDPIAALGVLQMNDQSDRNAVLNGLMTETRESLYLGAHDFKFKIDGREWSLSDNPPAAIKAEIRKRIDAALIGKVIEAKDSKGRPLFTPKEIMQNMMIVSDQDITNKQLEETIEDEDNAQKELLRIRDRTFLKDMIGWKSPLFGDKRNQVLSDELALAKKNNKNINLGRFLDDKLLRMKEAISRTDLSFANAEKALYNSGPVTIGTGEKAKTYKSIAEAFPEKARKFIVEVEAIASENANVTNRTNRLIGKEISEKIEIMFSEYDGDDWDSVVVKATNLLKGAGHKGINLDSSFLNETAKSFIVDGLTDGAILQRYALIRYKIRKGYAVLPSEWDSLPIKFQNEIRKINGGEPFSQTQMEAVLPILEDTLLSRAKLENFGFKDLNTAREHLRAEALGMIVGTYNDLLATNTPADALKGALKKFKDDLTELGKDREKLTETVKEWAKPGLAKYGESLSETTRRLNAQQKYLIKLHNNSGNAGFLKKALTQKFDPNDTSTHVPGETKYVKDQLTQWFLTGGPLPKWFKTVAKAIPGMSGEQVAIERAKALELVSNSEINKKTTTIQEQSTQLKNLNNSEHSSGQSDLSQSAIKNNGVIEPDTISSCFYQPATAIDKPYNFYSRIDGQPFKVNGVESNISETSVGDILTSLTGDLKAGRNLDLIRIGGFGMTGTHFFNMFKNLPTETQESLGLIGSDNEDLTKNVVFNQEFQDKLFKILLKEKSWINQFQNGSCMLSYRPVNLSEDQALLIDGDGDVHESNKSSHLSPRINQYLLLNGRNFANA